MRDWVWGLTALWTSRTSQKMIVDFTSANNGQEWIETNIELMLMFICMFFMVSLWLCNQGKKGKFFI